MNCASSASGASRRFLGELREGLRGAGGVAAEVAAPGDAGAAAQALRRVALALEGGFEALARVVELTSASAASPTTMRASSR
jgi:hypothetical protein